MGANPEDLLEISTLGGLAIQIGERPVNGFVSRKVAALLVYLAFDRRMHRRELLLDVFWDDLPQDRSMSNLRTILSNLQQQVGPYIVVTRQTVGMNLDSRWRLDAKELENAVQEAKQLELR